MQRSVVIIQCVRLPLHAAPISMCLAREHEWEGFKAGGYILTLGGGKKSKIWKQGREIKRKKRKRKGKKEKRKRKGKKRKKGEKKKKKGKKEKKEKEEREKKLVVSLVKN